MPTIQDFGFTHNRVENPTENSSTRSDISTEQITDTAAVVVTSSITSDKISYLEVDKLVTGTITSKQITLAVSDGDGDVFIAAGKTDFTNSETGFILGIDDSDNTPKFYIGSGTSYLNWDGTTLTIAGTLVAGEIHIPDVNTTANSFHVESDGSGWVGATSTNRTTAPIQWTPAGVINVGDSGGNYLTINGPSGTIGTDFFVSGSTGWQIDRDGNAEFLNITARGEFRTAVFVKDEIHADGGSVLIREAGLLRGTFNSGAGANSIDVQDPPSGHAALFAVNDILRIKDGSGSDNWFTVTAVSDQTTFYRYTATRESGSNATFYEGTAVVGYGTTSEGGIMLTSDQSNAPYIDIFLNGSTPWVSTTTKVRLGWLKGITDSNVGLSATDTWGLYSDNVYLRGTLVANAGKIGGVTNYWEISSGDINAVGSGDVAIRAGQTDYNTGTGFWLGRDSGTAKFSIGNASTNYLTWDGTTLSIGGTIALSSLPNMPSDSLLIAYFAFDSGATQTVDSSQNFNDANIIGATFGAGISGQAISFDGVNDELGAPFISDYSPGTSDFTLSFWMKMSAISTSNEQILIDIDDGTASGDRIVVYVLGTSSGNVGTINFGVFNGGVGVTITSTSRVDDGEWHHICLIRDYNSELKMYIDAVEEDQSAESIGSLTLSSSLVMGRRSFNTTLWYAGMIDEFRWYESVLSTANIQALYLSPAGSAQTIIGPGQIQTTSLAAISATLGSVSAGTVSSTQYNGGIFTIPIPSLAFNVDQDVYPVQISLSTSGNMVIAFTIDTGGNDNYILLRLRKMAGQYVPVYEAGGTASATFAAGAGYGATAVRGAAYHSSNFYWSHGTADFDRDADAGTAMTFSGTSDAGYLATDDTNLYILDKSDDLTVRKYTISGTTITHVSNITLDTSAPNGFHWDGTSFWGRNGGTIKKYNTSGTTQATYTLAETPTNLIPGVFVDDSKIYVAYIGYWGEYVAAASRLRASSITFIPVSAV